MKCRIDGFVFDKTDATFAINYYFLRLNLLKIVNFIDKTAQ